MTRRESVDAVVIGAGPAGCTAALRLSAMGRRVAVVERRASPRPRGAESVSPGIVNLLDYLAASDVLDGPGCLHDLPARVVWERREGDVLPPRGSVVVERTDFDARLLRRVREAGAGVYQPARVQQVTGTAGAWRVRLAAPDGVVDVESRFILEARGRAGPAQSRVPTGPPTVALWTDFPAPDRSAETRLEATGRGWLWGTPVPGGEYRVTTFVDLSTLARCGGVSDCFRSLLAEATLFGDVSPTLSSSPVHTRSATPYLDAESWRPGVLRIGETALALDPLSSSGVEKSMRLALQAAVAANTLMCDPRATGLAREFYESALIDSAASHTVWTREHYSRAWPGSGYPFWRDRAPVPAVRAEDEPGIAARFHAACAEQLRRSAQRASTGSRRPSESLDGLFEVAVELSAATRVVHLPCVVGDRVESRPAISHPHLERPVAFLGGHPLVPLIRLVPSARGLGHLLSLWSLHVPAATAAHIAGWLKLHRILEPARPGGTGAVVVMPNPAQG